MPFRDECVGVCYRTWHGLMATERLDSSAASHCCVWMRLVGLALGLWPGVVGTMSRIRENSLTAPSRSMHIISAEVLSQEAINKFSRKSPSVW